MSDLILEFAGDRWQLRDPDQPKILPVSVDFLTRDVQRRLKEPKGSQLLFRAVNAPETKTILDATAGLGGDSLMLASWGFEVTACEQNEKIFRLLEDGVKRLTEAAINEHVELASVANNLKVLNIDAVKKMSEPSESVFDIIYLDPMYPDLKSSALPKKEMQLLRKLFANSQSQDDSDQETLKILELALKVAKKRVVLKRPPAAGKVLHPSHSFEGKAVRFDIYTVSGERVREA